MMIVLHMKHTYQSSQFQFIQEHFNELVSGSDFIRHSNLIHTKRQDLVLVNKEEITVFLVFMPAHAPYFLKVNAFEHNFKQNVINNL